MTWPKDFCTPVRAVWAGALSLGLLGGCYPWCSECLQPGEGGPGLLMPEPNGASVHKMQEVQAEKAAASDFVFFLDEWYRGGCMLGPHGTYHLGHMLPRLPDVPFPVVIQPSPDQALNERRRQHIVTALLHAGFEDAEQRVLIAFPDAEGLYGDEAARIYADMLRPPQTGAQGGYGFQGGYGAQGGYGGAGAFTRPGYLSGGFGPGANPFGY